MQTTKRRRVAYLAGGSGRRRVSLRFDHTVIPYAAYTPRSCDGFSTAWPPATDSELGTATNLSSFYTTRTTDSIDSCSPLSAYTALTMTVYSHIYSPLPHDIPDSASTPTSHAFLHGLCPLGCSASLSWRCFGSTSTVQDAATSYRVLEKFFKPCSP